MEAIGRATSSLREKITVLLLRSWTNTTLERRAAVGLPDLRSACARWALAALVTAAVVAPAASALRVVELDLVAREPCGVPPGAAFFCVDDVLLDDFLDELELFLVAVFCEVFLGCVDLALEL